MATIVDADMTLNIDVCEARSCDSFSIQDTTGVYSSSNSGGYGAPNFLTSDSIDARLIITDPDGVSTTITVYPTFPDSTGTLIVTVTAAQLGVTTLTDGIYIIEFKVDFNNVNSQTIQKSVRKSVLFACTVSCCVSKLVAKVADTECSCDDVILKNALLANMLLKALCSSASCGNVTQTASLLARLNKLCSVENCGCSG